MDQEKPPNGRKAKESAAKAERLAKALRENLRRRKTGAAPVSGQGKP